MTGEQPGRENKRRTSTQFKNERFGGMVVQQSVRSVAGREARRFGSTPKLFRGRTADPPTSGFKVDSTFTKQVCRKAILFSQHAQKQVSSTYERVRKLLCFVSPVCKNTLAFAAEGHIDGGR